MDITGCKLEPLREDGDFSLYRARPPGNSVSVLVLVAASGAPRCIARLEHEYALAGQLDSSWAARPLALHGHHTPPALILDDNGGEPLTGTPGRPLELARFLSLATNLAGSIGHMHRCGLIHKDIKPSNVLVDADGNVRLTGFGIATLLPNERQPPTPPEVMAGTFAYMPPEQTGRMNRSIDARSDLYSLGVTLYEMLTGTLPFTATDAMGWIHCHIARKPVPPGERVSGIPTPVEEIVLKLLAKTAENRYQTAAGVEADLRTCLSAWRTHQRIDPFPLAMHDASDRLLIPETLYGREPQIEALLAAFDRVVQCGTTEMVLISGYAGIGKSSVVNELHKVLVPPRGLFAAGKFDQYKRDIPYVTLAQAFQSLVRNLLSRSEAEVVPWRQALLEALGSNGQLMINLIPELALIIGEQPPVPTLPPQDAQNRFQIVFRRFIGVFASAQHPLALFVDDLQWLDTATLDLLEHLVSHPDIRHLLLVGAYRDNEVGPSHPLTRTLKLIRDAGGNVQETALESLMPEHIGQLVADSLHCDRATAQPLAQLVHEKTGGNPFFSIQFLMALADEALLAFDHRTLMWNWDLQRIRAKGFTENVADLMAAKLGRLPDTTRIALGQLACLGNIAEIATVTLVNGEPEQKTHEKLWEAVRAGLVFRRENAYAFVHDRIQEAAYALIPPSERAAVHLQIGRLLAERTAPGDIEEAIFDIVNHLNRGAALIAQQDERERVVTLNLRAGKRAMNSTAYGSACNYLTQAAGLLSSDAWTRCYEETFELYLAFSECEYLVGNFATADALFDRILGRARLNLDRAKVYSLRMKLYQVAGKYDDSFAVALDALRDFGVTIPQSDEAIHAAVDAEFRDVPVNLAGRAIAELLDAPAARDPATRAIVDLLVEAMPCAYIGWPALFPLITLKAVNLSLRHGNTDQSSYVYGNYAVMLVSLMGEIASGVQFSEMSLLLNEKFNNQRLRGKLLHLHGDHINFWRSHIATDLPILERAIHACLEVGDLVFTGYLAFETLWQLIEKGDVLEDVRTVSAKYAAFARQSRNQAVCETVRLEQQFIASLQGSVTNPLTLEDSTFDEAACFADIVKASFGCGIVFYHIMKQMLAFLGGRYAEALESAVQAESVLGPAMGMPIEATFHFFHALTLTALYPDASAEQQQEYELILRADLKKYELWADNCPDNYRNRHALISAEIARIESRDLEAMRAYEEAIRSAREHGFIQNEGIAHELAARFYLARGYDTIADTYLRNARSCYERWGADGKVRQLEHLYPQLLRKPSHEDSIVATSADQLDLATVVKVSQAIFNGVDLNELIHTLMVLAIEHAGADRGLLVLPWADSWRIEAEAIMLRDAVEVRLPRTRLTPEELPESVLRYVLRTRESVLLDDAADPSPFSDDEYIGRRQCQSVLCLPLIKHTKLIGVLYLENCLAAQVFTPARIAALQLLASQAAISLENARLYADLKHAEALLADAQQLSHMGSFDWHVASAEITWSEECFRILGYDPDTRPTIELLLARTHPEDAPLVQRVIAEAVNDRRGFDIEYRLSMPDGAIKHLHAVAHVVVDEPERLRLVGALMDVTVRQQAHAALERSEQRYRSLFRDMPVGLWQVDALPLMAMMMELRAQGVENLSTYIDANPEWLDRARAILAIEEVNNYAVTMFGARDRSELIGPLSWIWRESPGTLRRVLESRYRGEDHFEETTRMPTLDGRIINVQFSVARPRTANDLGIGLISLVDLTERIHAQEMLERLQADFAHAARISVLGELTASIAHELNQPLAAIVTNGQAAQRWLGRPEPDFAEARGANTRMVADARRAVDIVSRIRGMATRQTPEHRLVWLDELIDGVLVFLRHEVQMRGVAVLHHPAPGAPRVLADRVQLQQVIVNLAVNAMQAMEQACSEERRITIRTIVPDVTTLRCAVEDSGPGIAPDHLQRLFESFFTTKPDGMGMGLPICRSIIEAHGGHIAADNESIHAGARFYFELPAA
ncbi:putative ATPase/signal transduction histidine kinase/GAF domain-containing protein [Paraburkholderia sp. GAS41]|uniref:trifunctional serine/threonine-protein kinase/ATP-binding protein/sensor histidine kinase n=1 Tax=Paraburkholderia sp. GAS41 TaxID=3035134 RepID=UPI003D20B9CD